MVNPEYGEADVMKKLVLRELTRSEEVLNTLKFRFERCSMAERERSTSSIWDKHEKVETSITVRLGRSHYEALTFDGGETWILCVEEIVDSSGQIIEPVWESDWTEIAPGIKTKLEAVEIQRSACPVCVYFKRQRYGRVYKDKTYTEERYSTTDYYRIEFETT